MNRSKFQVEYLTESRWAEGRDLRLEALREEPFAFGSSYKEESLLSEKEWKARNRNALYVMENNIPVGMMVLIRHSNQKIKHIGNIYGLFVKMSHRGRGIGNLLIEKAIQIHNSLSYIKKIRLAVNREQESAIALYKKHGFNVTGILSKEIYYKGTYYDELIMELLL